MERPKEITDIKQFIGYVSKDLSDNKIRIFRGQQNTSWDLKAAVFRDNYSDNKEKQINEIIKKYNFDEFSNKELYFDELIQMQHYGVPTRLLDWSYNPLISLYFTVAYDEENDGYIFENSIPKNKIYLFNTSTFKKLSELFKADVELDVLSFENDKEIKNILTDAILKSKNNYYIDATLQNNRIRAQQGCFSIVIDKKQKFINYIIDEIFINYIREFLSTTKIPTEIQKLINKNSNTDFKDILPYLTESYRSKKDISFYKSTYKDYIRKIKYENIDFCQKEHIEDIDGILENNSDDFATFIINRIKLLDTKDYELPKDDLIRYKIKKSNKAKLKKQLENIGITSTFVYPDIQGTIDHIRNVFK